MAFGKCLLTGKSGTFVKSHLTPLALTSPETGAYFIQSGEGTRPTRNHSSWYDKAIVTRKGEDILAAVDTQAIAILRELRLVWSGWPQEEASLSVHDFTGIDDSHGIRRVRHSDLRKLRLFFVSLLWRWGVSNLRAAAEIVLPQQDIDALRDLLLRMDCGDPAFYPVTLTQLSTRGPRQNLSPLSQNVPSHDGKNGPYPIFRFYFDGLIAHIHRGPALAADPANSMILGATDAIVIPTVTYEASMQHVNLQAGIHDAYQEYSASMEKLTSRAG